MFTPMLFPNHKNFKIERFTYEYELVLRWKESAADKYNSCALPAFNYFYKQEVKEGVTEVSHELITLKVDSDLIQNRLSRNEVF